MGYANPIERMGLAEFVRAAQAAGVDGVLIVDYPPEESADWLQALLGKKPGDSIEVEAPRGKWSATIVSVGRAS